MHPPLDRPHPDCQEHIEALRHCHDTRSIFKIWACNEIKVLLDTCFRREKADFLKEINKDMDEKRREEDEAFADAMGHKMTFEQYLSQDKEYQAELRKAANRKPDQYQETSSGRGAAT